MLFCAIFLLASGSHNVRADGTNRSAATPVPQAMKFSDVFAKPLSQVEADKKFQGKFVAGILSRPHDAWVAEQGGVTVDLVVPKKPKWYEHSGEVVQVEVSGMITKISIEQRRLTITCEPQDIRVLTVE